MGENDEGTDVDVPLNRRREKRNRRVVVALFISVIMVVAALASAMTYGWGPFARSNSTTTGPVGPGVRVQVDPPSIAAIAHEPFGAVAGSINIQIFSPFPSASTSYIAKNLTGLDPTTNPYLDYLFQGSPNSTGVVTGNLSSQFYVIDKAWLTTMSPLTTNVSLQMYATLSVVQNGTDEVYAYSNNLPYNPHAPPSLFSTTVTFAARPTFSNPAYVVTSSSSITPSGPPPPPSCNPGWAWEYVNLTWISNGGLPLILVNVENAPANTLVTYGLDYTAGTFQLSFNSVSGYTSSGSTLSAIQMSSNPSASVAQTDFQGVLVTGGASNAAGLQPVGMIALTNVAMWVTNYRWDYLNSKCLPTSYGNQYMTTLVPDGLSSSSFVFASPALPTWFPGVVNFEKDWAEFTTESPANSAFTWGGSGFDLYQEMTNANGYSNAEQAYNNVENFLTAISMDLGLLAIASAAAGWLPGDGDADAVACVSIIAAITGYMTSFMTLANSISFSTTVSYGVEAYTVTEPGTGADNYLFAQINAQTLGTELQLPSNTYYPDMPLIYVDVT